MIQNPLSLAKIKNQEKNDILSSNKSLTVTQRIHTKYFTYYKLFVIKKTILTVHLNIF